MSPLKIPFISVLSFISETPALENIKALVDGSISMISKPRLKNWCKLKPLLSKILYPGITR